MVKIQTPKSSASNDDNTKLSTSVKYEAKDLANFAKELVKESGAQDEIWKNQFKSIQDENDKLIKKITTLEENIESSNARSFAILAIFSTVFTFIAVNISVFKEVKTFFEAAKLMVLNAFLCCIIISIPLIILEIFNKKNFPKDAKKMIWKLFYITIGLLIILLLFSYFGDFTFDIGEKLTVKIGKF